MPTNTPADISDLMTVREVAAMTGKSRDTIRRWHRRGELPAIRFGQEWRFNRRTVERLLQAGTRAVGWPLANELDEHINVLLSRAPELTATQRDRLAQAVDQ